MPPVTKARSAPKDFTANLGCEAGVQGDVRPETVDQVHSRAFVFRNSAFGISRADTFRNVQHPDLRANTATRVSANPQQRSHLAGLLRSERQLVANPPFNDSDWFCKDDDVRWQFGVPPKGNTNFAWVQHFKVHKLGDMCDHLLDMLDAIKDIIMPRGYENIVKGNFGEVIGRLPPKRT